MIGRPIGELRVGQSAELTRPVTEDDLVGLIEAIGDRNPIHRDAAFAAETAFKEPIAPGIFTAGLISAVIGTRLPGPGAIYLSQSLNFTKPVKRGDIITAWVEIVEIVPERNRIRLLTVCRNQRGEDVLSGEAWVMPPKRAIVYAEGPTAGAVTALQPWAWVAQAMTFWGRLGLRMLSAALDRPRG